MDGDDSNPVKKPIHRFKKGDPKPPNSGSQKGQEYAMTKARKEAYPKLRKEINEKSLKYKGLSTKELLAAEGFDWRVEAIVLIREESTKTSDKVKLLDIIGKKMEPDQKAVEHKERPHTIRVVLPGSAGYESIDVDADSTILDAPSQSDISLDLLLVDADLEEVLDDEDQADPD